MQEVETVAEHCKHEDCVYRSYIGGGAIPICFYAVIENESRKCKISECDKYRGGEKIQPRLNSEFMILWEIELYDDGEHIRQRY